MLRTSCSCSMPTQLDEISDERARYFEFDSLLHRARKALWKGLFTYTSPCVVIPEPEASAFGLPSLSRTIRTPHCLPMSDNSCRHASSLRRWREAKPCEKPSQSIPFLFACRNQPTSGLPNRHRGSPKRIILLGLSAARVDWSCTAPGQECLSVTDLLYGSSVLV